MSVFEAKGSYLETKANNSVVWIPAKVGMTFYRDLVVGHEESFSIKVQI